MAAMQDGSGQLVRHAPFVWRSTLRGVLVLDDQQRLVQLEGLAATVWIALGDGEMDLRGIRSLLATWHVEAEPDGVREAVEQLAAEGLLHR